MTSTRPSGIENLHIQQVHVWDVYRDQQPIYTKPPIAEQSGHYAIARDYTVDLFPARQLDRIESDESFLSCVREAKRFVQAELGYTSDCPVYVRPKTSIYDAVYYVDEHSIDAEPHSELDDYYRRALVTGALIHEMAHESADAVELFVINEQQSDSRLHRTVGWRLGLQAMRFAEESQFVTGHFYEEAFAESVAAKWRHQAMLGYRERELYRLMTHYGAALPVKYHTANRELVDDGGHLTTYTGPSALAAYAMELLAEHTGEDLYELMRLSRQKATQVAAKRRLVQIIDGVQPGLYRELRDLQYDAESGDFQRGLEMVQAAIATPQQATTAQTLRQEPSYS